MNKVLRPLILGVLIASVSSLALAEGRHGPRHPGNSHAGWRYASHRPIHHASRGSCPLADRASAGLGWPARRRAGRGRRTASASAAEPAAPPEANSSREPDGRLEER